ncbi:MAG: HNH endonuclease [bacterium]
MDASIREQVRQRANFACEFCGISETDAGGQLTIDHYQPKGKGGDDGLDNLIYCCARCNQYKLDYWPNRPNDPPLWNPRQEIASQHFLELADGIFHPLTTTGAFTLQRLRLNRPPLVTHRLRKHQEAERARLLTQYRDLARLAEQLLTQQTKLMEEQQRLLKEQRRLLQLLLGIE